VLISSLVFVNSFVAMPMSYRHMNTKAMR